MTPENTWLFYSQAAWNVDHAAYVAKTLMENLPDRNSHSTKVIWFSAYRFSIVSYCSPFMHFRTADGKEKGLGTEIVPTHLLETHKQIRDYRDRILAHTDIGHMRAFGVNEGLPVTLVDADLAAPPVERAFELFAAISDILIRKLESLNNENRA